MKQLEKKKQRRINWIPYAFVAPNFIGFAIFILLPMLFSLVVSFTNFNIFKGFDDSVFVGLNNYIAMFQDEWFLKAVKNNLLYTSVTIPCLIGFSIVIASILNGKVFCGDLLKTLFFIPYITSVVAISTVWMMIFNPGQGILNQILRAIGITNVPGWTGSLQWALPSIMIVGIWMGLGYNIIVYMSGLQSIPKDIYESAQIDGARTLQTFFHITIPMLRGTTFFLLITNIITSFQVFGTINIITDGGPGNATTVISHYIYLSGFRYNKMGYASAMAWFLLAIIFLITMFQWKTQRKHEENM